VLIGRSAGSGVINFCLETVIVSPPCVMGLGFCLEVVV